MHEDKTTIFLYTDGAASGKTDRVDYLGGATFSTHEYGNGPGVSLGNYINVNNTGIVSGNFDDYILTDPTYMHEYGHYIDSQRYGLTYLFEIGVPSLKSAARHGTYQAPDGYHNAEHRSFRTEKRANNNAKDYFSKHFGIDWNSDEFWSPEGIRIISNAYPL